MTRTLSVLAVLVCGWACSESVTTGVIVPEPVQTDLGIPDAVPAPVDAAPMADAVVSQRFTLSRRPRRRGRWASRFLRDPAGRPACSGR